MRRFYVGAKALIIRQSSVLLLREADEAGRWDLPGGRLEGTETLHQALRRELLEELPGIASIDVRAQVGTTTVSRLIGDPGLVLVMYRVEVTLPDPVTTSPDHDAHAWVSLAQVHERLDPSVAAVVARCRYGLDG